MNRTLIAPTPSIVHRDPGERRDERPGPGDDPQAVEDRAADAVAFALAAAAALGHARLAGDAEDEHDRDEERGRVDDEDGPHLARRPRR